MHSLSRHAFAPTLYARGMPSTIGERIKAARIKARLSKRGLAKACSISDASVSDWESGKSKGLKPENLYSAARALGVTMEWLATGAGPMRDPDAVEPGPDLSPVTAAPIVGRAALLEGENGYFVEEGDPTGHGDGFIDHPTRDPNAYSLRVVGDSMVPAIRSGWFVVCEPNSPCRPGEYVHVLTKGGQHMVKELIFERETEITLLSINGNKRLTISRADLEYMHHIGGLYPPSKRRL